VGIVLPFFLAFLLPFIWVFSLDKKDPHPEPKLSLLISFVLGIISAFLSYFPEQFFYNLGLGNENQTVYFLLNAFLEEFFKFALIYLFIFPTRVFDEPIDGMIYMIFSAFGFAFVENVAIVYRDFFQPGGQLIYLVLFFRFMGANFLHILTSSLIGFGYSYMLTTKRLLVFVFSFLSAVILHFFYNLSIIKSGNFLILPLLWSIFFIVLFELDYLKLWRKKEINPKKEDSA